MNIYEINPDHSYELDANSLIGLRAVMTRLYDDSKPFAVDERRNLAQRMHALLEHAEEIA